MSNWPTELYPEGAIRRATLNHACGYRVGDEGSECLHVIEPGQLYFQPAPDEPPGPLSDCYWCLMCGHVGVPSLRDVEREFIRPWGRTK